MPDIEELEAGMEEERIVQMQLRFPELTREAAVARLPKPHPDSDVCGLEDEGRYYCPVCHTIAQAEIRTLVAKQEALEARQRARPFAEQLAAALEHCPDIVIPPLLRASSKWQNRSK